MSFRPNHNFGAITLYSEKNEIKSYWEKLSEVHVCANCDRHFNLLTSMGKLECTQHNGTIQEDGTYSCCGERELPLRFQNNIDVIGLFPSGYCGRINGYNVRNKQPVPKKRRGCQKCDCNTSQTPWTHSNRIHISEMAPLIPHIRKDADENGGTWMTQRVGFDDGYIRRCEVKTLQIPDGNWKKLKYESIEGQEKIETKENLPKYGTMIETIN